MSRLPHRCRIALGRGQGCPAPFTFRPNWGPKGRKKIQDPPSPPPAASLSQGLDDPFPLIWRSGSAIARWLLIPYLRLFFFAFFPSVFLRAVKNKDQEKRTPKAFSIFSPTEDYLLIILSLKRGCKKQAGARLRITLHQRGGVDFLDTFFCPEGGGTSSGLIFGYSWVAEGLKPYSSLLRTKIKILNFITLFVQAIPSIQLRHTRLAQNNTPCFGHRGNQNNTLYSGAYPYRPYNLPTPWAYCAFQGFLKGLH